MTVTVEQTSKKWKGRMVLCWLWIVAMGFGQCMVCGNAPDAETAANGMLLCWAGMGVGVIALIVVAIGRWWDHD